MAGFPNIGTEWHKKLADSHSISWLTVVWVTIAAVCFSLALVHLMFWWRRRKAWEHATFALVALATIGSACNELQMMWAETQEAYSTVLRWTHVPWCIIVVTLVVFVRKYLRAGRPWLAWMVCGLRILSLIINFFQPMNLNFHRITIFKHVQFLGEPVSIAVGEPNPWMLVGQLSLVLFVIFVADAAVTVWRRGDRRKAWSLGGSLIFLVVAATAQILMTYSGIFLMPTTISLFFLPMVAAMGLELSDEMLRASQLSAELNESREQLSLTARTAGAGLWSWDYKTGQIWATEKTRALYGFAPSEEMTYSTFLERVHPDDRERVDRAAQQAFQESSEFRSEYRALLPDKTVRWVKAQGQAFLDSSGEPERMTGVSIDISRHKQQEGEMAELRLELAHLSRVMVMNELSTSLAHEINQPLGAILNNASAAALLIPRAEDTKEECAAIVTDVIQDARRAGDVIRRIRGIVKRTDAQSEPMQINALIAEVVDLFRDSLSTNRVSVLVCTKSDIPEIRGDRVHVQQVLVNLITNAMDALRDTPIKTLTIRSDMDSYGGILVSVCDSGTGIDPAVKDKIFNPFFTTKKDGLGMGLRICQSIIEEHGGRIRAENNPDGGATFTFTLKIRPGETA